MADKNPDQENTSSPQPSPRHAIPASPPNFVSVDQLLAASHVVNDMKMAHEIAIDDNFKLEPNEPPVGSLEYQVTETMKRAFWDALSEKLNSQPPDYSHVLVLIEDVKQRLISCLPSTNSPINNRIQEVLDMELIQQKIEHEAFDLSYYAQFVQEIMRQLCAPVRDEMVANISNITEILPLFKEIFRVLDIMNLDLANFTIQQMRPVIKQQVVEYERNKFNQFLESQKEAGIDGVEYTREWIERSFDTLEESINEKEKTPVYWSDKKDLELAYNNVLHGAFLELLNWSNHIWPETVLMDQNRFMEVSSTLNKSLIIASSLVVALNNCNRVQLTQHNTFRDRLKSEITSILHDVPETRIRIKLVNVSEQLISSINQQLGNMELIQLSTEEAESLKVKITDVIEPDHPVRSLLKRRVMSFIFDSLSRRGGNNQHVQLPSGLGVVEQEITEQTAKILRLVNYNKSVFSTYYTSILNELVPTKD